METGNSRVIHAQVKELPISWNIQITRTNLNLIVYIIRLTKPSLHIKGNIWTSLAVQWLRLCTSNAGGAGSNPGQGTKIPRAMRRSQT